MKKERTASQEEIKKLIDDDDATFDGKVEESIKSENRRLWRGLFVVVFGLVTILVVGCMVSIYNAAYNVHPYFGYAVGILLIILLVCLVGIPTIRVFLLPYYMVGKNSKNNILVRHNNAQVVKRVSQNLIEYHANTAHGYVSEDNLKTLALTLAKGKRTEINETLKKIYDTDVSKKVHAIILKSETKSFCCTAISQNDKMDALSVLFINLRMIKSILFAYGTRPSMYKLVKIYTRIIVSSLVAYGMQNISVSNILTKFVKATANIVPALGTLIDSAVQGATGAILTMIIGYKTKSYVYKEFKMVVEEEKEYANVNYVDADLKMALEDYNDSKELMQAQVQSAKKKIEDTTKAKNKQEKADNAENEEVDDSNDEASRKKRANSDLNLLLGTSNTMKNNGKRKKILKDNQNKPPKKIGVSWSLHKNRSKTEEDDTKLIAAETTELDENADNIDPQEEPVKKGLFRRKKK